ncbi:hypothetical protein ACH4Q7_08075 [Streptomyces roseolus]|uniref:hypothetical protein n=2 Tax=Streptomyces roseolus TaxID=67358 RepID=UPI0037A1F633
MDTHALSATLASFGISLQGIEETVKTCPPEVAGLATSCGPEDGRVDEVIHYDSPTQFRDVNDAWMRLATRFGLLGTERQFLLCVRADDASDAVWARVRLGDDWNIAGRVPNAIRGPWTGGLLTMSLSGSVVVLGTTYQEYMSVLALPDPHRVPVLRRYAQYMIEQGDLSEPERENVAAWLDQD